MKRFGIAYPKVDRSLLRRNVMVMEYLEAEGISGLEPATARILLERTGAWLARAIFVDGFFYEDFHPGNIKWLPAAKGDAGRPLVFDFGRMGEFTPVQRQRLIAFLFAAEAEDAAATADALGDMSSGQVKGNLVEEIAGFFAAKNGRASGRVQALFGIAARHGLDLAPAYLQFIKAVLSWEGTMRAVDPAADFAAFAVPAIVEALEKDEMSKGPGGGSGGSTGAPSGDLSPSGGGSSQPLSVVETTPNVLGGLVVIDGPGDATALQGVGPEGAVDGGSSVNLFSGVGVFASGAVFPISHIVAPSVLVPVH